MITERVNSYLSIGANIAVLVGLVFVGLELRNSGAAVSAQASANIASGFNQLNMQLAGDPRLANIMEIGSEDPAQLTFEEAISYAYVVRSTVNQYTQLLHLYESGLVSDSQWRVYAQEAAHILDSPGGKLFVAGNAVAQDLVDAVAPYRSSSYTFDQRLGRALPE